jgi:hypothetical protein
VRAPVVDERNDRCVEHDTVDRHLCSIGGPTARITHRDSVEAAAEAVLDRVSRHPARWLKALGVKVVDDARCYSGLATRIPVERRIAAT